MGHLIDLAFPDVSPTASKQEVEILADKMIQDVQVLSSSPCPIHVMGEMTLTYSLVNRLKTLGYICYASTSERIFSIDDNGDKVVKFDFVRFREY